jgi:hypothetical protein
MKTSQTLCACKTDHLKSIFLLFVSNSKKNLNTIVKDSAHVHIVELKQVVIRKLSALNICTSKFYLFTNYMQVLLPKKIT